MENSPPVVQTSVAEQVADYGFRQLGSHLFVPVGESRSIAGMGEFLEAVSMDGRDAFSIDGSEITALTSGATCFRFKYRDVPFENGIQTVCGVAFESIGECAGLPTARLDLNAFLEPGVQPVGDANLLESGDGLFYAICVDDHSRYVLQPSSADLPPLYWHMADALGDGPYSLGDSEMGSQRAGVVTTFGGGEIAPKWVVAVSREVHEFDITPDGLVINDEDCDKTPACSNFPGVVRSGDVMVIGTGLPFDMGKQAMGRYSLEVIDEYVSSRIGLPWERVIERDPHLAPLVLLRLFNIDIFDQIVPFFDGMYDLRGKGVPAAIGSFPTATSIMPLCRPEPENQTECRVIEDAIGAYEGRIVAGLKSTGPEIWGSVTAEFRDDGEYYSLDENWRPVISEYDGLIVRVLASGFWETASIAESMADAVRGVAGDVASGQPVILMSSGPPIAAATGAEDFCEAEICVSDFDAAYEQFEGWLAAALEAFPPGQIIGIGTALFEGSHFDIRDPYELDLNRVGETGYNNPTLNIWRATR